MPKRLTRGQLYTLVWERPITHLAREFGLSDVALHKICKKHRVPTPPPGYWAKKAAGKLAKISALPDPGDATEILIHERSTSRESEAMGQARAGVLAALQAPGEPTAGSHDPIIERTLAKLSSKKAGADELIHVSGSGLIKVEVRALSVDRSSEFLRELAAAATTAGIRLARGTTAAEWQYNGQAIAFEFVEAAERVEHVATDKELADVEKWKRDRAERHRRYGYWDDWGEPKIPKWEYRYQGRLMVRLDSVRLKSEQNPYGEPIRHAFAETRTRRLEKSIPAILSTIAAMGEAKRSNAEFEERERQAAAERARRYAEEERRRIAEARAVRLLDELLEERASADRLRGLIDPLALEGVSGRSARWLEWAQARLALMERQLNAEALEQRLAAAGLFGSSDVVGDSGPKS